MLVVAAYGLILPPAVLDMPRLGALNIHASLLPRWRGAAPIQRALLAGDRETGITIMQMDAGLDTGPMLLRAAVAICADDDAGTLHDKLAALGARLIVVALADLARGTRGAPRRSRPHGVTYAARSTRDEARDRLERGPRRELERQVRAFDPVPGRARALRGEPAQIWRARARDGAGDPGDGAARRRGRHRGRVRRGRAPARPSCSARAASGCRRARFPARLSARRRATRFGAARLSVAARSA